MLILPICLSPFFAVFTDSVPPNYVFSRRMW